MNINTNRRGVCFGEFIGIELVNNRFGAVAGFCTDSLFCNSHESGSLFDCMGIKKQYFHVMEIQICPCL